MKFLRMYWFLLFKFIFIFYFGFLVIFLNICFSVYCERDMGEGYKEY